MIELLFIIFLFFLIFFMCGIRIILLSPIIFEMDRDRGTFIKKTKYIWQKDYQTKLCYSLSDILNAHHNPIYVINRLYLKMCSHPEKVLLLRCIDIGLLHGGYGDISFIETKVKINNFLRHKEERMLTIDFSLSELGGYTLLYASMIMCFIIMVAISSFGQ